MVEISQYTHSKLVSADEYLLFNTLTGAVDIVSKEWKEVFQRLSSNKNQEISTKGFKP
ncbi:MAG: hypothetical protein ACFFBD_06305 [Candidatus Hodarchaeota archaeon]